MRGIQITNKLSALLKDSMSYIRRNRDIFWAFIWSAGFMTLLLWNFLFLNSSAFSLVYKAFGNSLFSAFAVITFSTLLGFGFTYLSYFSRVSGNKYLGLGTQFFINLIKSIPQILGILAGYIYANYLIIRDMTPGSLPVLVLLSFSISLFVFPEIYDLMQERIKYFERKDFVNAMLCCGINRYRIIFLDVLLVNSRFHLFHKIISIFGITIFLQCSVDFIISVGLSTDISAANLPVTLGSLLAKMDSKQDVLAVSNIWTDPFYIFELFFVHLQGISIAFLIVFTLFSIYKISNGFFSRKDLF
ncbi:MAG: hypothetical protein K9I71_05965 [Ignavibacteriales bacterium]|nr:hypothetical protein [Ignavibacteriales bacterium]MCF8315650.1 hypothetical protein [Ignavibacteriales bacterium]MCF8437156.1 hypothetical protein [Ignavibacteriales bacterium]